MIKTIKIFLKNCPSDSSTQIYCIKHESGEDLFKLKEKIFRRCPNLRLANDPAIFWYDLENDKIRITCDDDLKFFIDESKIQKLIFEFEKIEPSRKRTSSILTADDFSDSSKRLRRRMEKIDLSSDTSIDLSSESEDEKVENHEDKIEQEVENVQPVDNAPKVKIISIDIIKPVEETNQNNSESSFSHIENVLSSNVVENFAQPSSTNIEHANNSATNTSAEKINEPEGKNKQRKQSDSNRIVISDSSDNEEENNENDQNRRFSAGNYSSAYSFADVNGERFESRASFDDDFRRYRNRRRRDEFDENARRTYRHCSDNMRRMFQQANVARAQAQAASDQAMRNLRSSTNFLPDLLSTFQSHFRPLFQTNSPFNQNFNRP